MVRLLRFLIVVLMLSLGAALLVGQQMVTAQKSSNKLTKVELLSILTRDLQSYFATRQHKPVRVEFEMLNNGKEGGGKEGGGGEAPPRYYLWVRVLAGHSVVEQGATRCELVKKSLQITHFVPRNQIIGNIGALGNIFPTAMRDAISQRAQASAPVVSN